jgi:hypothetical protein
VRQHLLPHRREGGGRRGGGGVAYDAPVWVLVSSPGRRELGGTGVGVPVPDPAEGSRGPNSDPKILSWCFQQTSHTVAKTSTSGAPPCGISNLWGGASAGATSGRAHVRLSRILQATKPPKAHEANAFGGLVASRIRFKHVRAPKWLPPGRPINVANAARRGSQRCSFWPVPGFVALRGAFSVSGFSEATI